MISCLAAQPVCSYQGVNWRNTATWACNARWDPAASGDFPNDGVSSGPMELIFVPVDAHSLKVSQPAALAAQKYAAWQEAVLARKQRPEDISGKGSNLITILLCAANAAQGQP